MSRVRLKNIIGQLFPRGRAFKIPRGGTFDKLNSVAATVLGDLCVAASGLLDSVIADNPNFTADDATQWERRLGIASAGTATPLSVRIQAINQKLNYPNTNAPRQHYKFIERQLRDAGFDVRVYENNTGGVARSPEQVLGTVAGAAYHATTVQHKTALQHGAIFNRKVANSLDAGTDALFVIGSNYRSTFFISGPTLTTFATVPAARETEFRQLILQLKPQQTVAYLFVNYV